MKNTKYDIDWLKNQTTKDRIEVERYKNQLIDSLKRVDKKELFKEKKITLWMRIKKTMGF
jgi:hypothetical protein